MYEIVTRVVSGERVAASNEGGHTQISRTRRETLEGRDYTTAVKTQMLSLNRKIEDSLLDRIDTARKARNDFAYLLKDVDRGAAGDAIRTAADLLARAAGIQIAVPLSVSFML